MRVSSGQSAIARVLVASLVLSALMGQQVCSAEREPSAAPAIEIDLDAFDRSKRIATLPNGMHLGFVDTGPHSGDAVVLIHGYTDNARDWVPLIPYLDKRFRLIIVDIRGHGNSSKPDCCYARIDFAYDIRLLLDRLQIHRAHIVGHSLGSVIAQTFAEYWPERANRVVLISSSAGRGARCAPAVGPPSSKAMDFDAFRATIAKLKDPLDPESPFMIDWYASPSPVDGEFMRRQRRDAAAIPVKVWLAVYDQGIIGTDLQSTLPWLKAPTLLVWGAKDPIFDEQDRCALRSALPGAQVKVYPDYGHNPFWEGPRQVADAINSFLLGGSR